MRSVVATVMIPILTVLLIIIPENCVAHAPLELYEIKSSRMEINQMLIPKNLQQMKKSEQGTEGQKVRGKAKSNKKHSQEKGYRARGAWDTNM